MATKKNSIDLSIPKSKQVRGYEIKRLALGGYLQAMEAIRTMPEELMAACFPGMDVTQILAQLKTITPDVLKTMMLNIVTVVPGKAIELLGLLTGIDHKTLLNDEDIGLDGAAEMFSAFLELNGIENFMKAARELAKQLRAATESGAKTGYNA